MKTRLLYTVILICSFLLFIVSCTGKSQKTDSLVSVIDSFVADANYKKTLREQMSEINGENERAEQLQKKLQEKEEKERKEYERFISSINDYFWMNGKWYLSTSIEDPYVGRIDFRVTLNINTNNHSISLFDEAAGDGYSGTYTLNESQNMISCKGNYISFDPDKKLFFEEYKGKREYYHKM